MGSQPYAVCVILRADRQGFFFICRITNAVDSHPWNVNDMQ